MAFVRNTGESCTMKRESVVHRWGRRFCTYQSCMKPLVSESAAIPHLPPSFPHPPSTATMRTKSLRACAPRPTLHLLLLPIVGTSPRSHLASMRRYRTKSDERGYRSCSSVSRRRDGREIKNSLRNIKSPGTGASCRCQALDTSP